MEFCRLCLRADVPIRKSHIFPEFLYGPSYDEKHRGLYLDRGPGGGGRELLQKGPRERLLCASCETHLSVFEGYGATILRRLLALDGYQANPVTWFTNVDYTKFKIFTMSLLWRASVSRKVMFRKVQLSLDEEPLRRMIVLADPGEPWEYGCALNQLQETSDFQRVVMFPGEMNLGGHKGFHFMAWGFHWWFVVSRHASSLPYDELFLTVDGRLPIRVSGTTASDLVQGMLRGEKVVEKPAANPGHAGDGYRRP